MIDRSARKLGQAMAVAQDEAIRAAYRWGCKGCGIPTHPEAMCIRRDDTDTTVGFTALCVNCMP